MQRGLHWDHLLLQNIHIDTYSYTQFNGRKSQFWTRSGTQRAILLKESIHICSTQALECFNGGPDLLSCWLTMLKACERTPLAESDLALPVMSMDGNRVLKYVSCSHQSVIPLKKARASRQMSDNSNLHWLQRSLIAASDHMIFN